MNRTEWGERPQTAQFGPACWQSWVLGVLTAIFVRPVMGLLTGLGLVINRFFPDALQRARLDVIDKPFRVLRALPGTRVTRVALPDCPAEHIVAPIATDSPRLIIYFHGSALVTLGLNSHRRFVSKLSEVARAQVLNVGYRLAPRADIDDAIDDGLDAYRHALAAGFAAERIVLAGDSAGGLLASLTALRIRDDGLPVPAGQVLLSPLTSSDMDIKYQAMRAHRDVLFPLATVRFLYRVFATVNGTRELPVMPADADPAGLGPFLIQVGTDEMLRNDSFELAERLTAAGVPVWVQIWHKAMHMFQLSFDVNPDARAAVAEIADFVRHVTGARSEATA